MTTGVYSDATFLTLGYQGTDVLKVRDGGVDVPPVGSTTFPAVSFETLNTGLFNDSGAVGVSVAGQKRARVTDTEYQLTDGQLQAPQNASLSAPAFAFSAETNSGFTSTGNGSCSFVVGGDEILKCTPSVSTVGSVTRYKGTVTGSSSAAAIQFDSDPNTGIFYPDANSVSLLAGGSQLKSNVNTIVSDTPLQIASGTESAPSLAFTGNTNTGCYPYAADEFGIACGGATPARFRTNGAYFPLGMRIGASATTIINYRLGSTTPTMTLNGQAFTGENHIVNHTRFGRLIVLQVRLRWTSAPATTGTWVLNNILPLAPSGFPASPYVTNHQGASITNNATFFTGGTGSLNLTANKVSTSGVTSTSFAQAEFGNASTQGVCFTYMYIVP